MVLCLVPTCLEEALWLNISQMTTFATLTSGKPR